MDKKFLRVGNYLLNEYNDRINYAMVVKVRDSGKLTIRIEQKGDLYFNVSPVLSKISSIAINKEWLESFGFMLMPETEYTLNTYELNGFKVWDKKGDFSEVVYLTNHMSVVIKGVHHLQNLYYELFQEQLQLKDGTLVTLRV